MVAAAANLSRTGGLRLLSSCTRPLLLFTSTSHSHSHSNSLFLNHPNYYNPKSYKFSLTNASLSLSSSPKSTTRVYCTTSPNVAAAEDSSSSAPSNSDISDESVTTTTTTIKDVANTLEIKVGKILKAWRHEEADSLYVEEVDVGEAEPRIICSGLVKYMPLDHLQDKKVVVLANLKARNMRGVKSYGMLMAASDASHENVELLAPPEGSLPGERVWFGSADELENLPDTASPNQVQKKKIWESVQPHLKTDASCVAALEGVHIMRTSAGVVVSPSLKDANIS